MTQALIALLKAIQEGNISDIKKCLKKINDFNDSDGDGIQILHLVVNSPNLNIAQTNQMIDELIAKGVNINGKDSLGNTALHHAANFEHGLEVVQYLVKKGARPTAKNNAHKTARDIAKKCEHSDIEKWLFQEEIIYRQQRTEHRFFKASKVKASKKKDFKALSKQFHQSRRKKQADVIDVTDRTGREVVMADGNALKKLVLFTRKKDDFKKKLVQEKKWHNGGYEKEEKINSDWPREGIKYRWDNETFPDDSKKELIVKSQYQPLFGHQGNLHMYGIGDYGNGKGSILDAIYEVTKKKAKDESEKAKEKVLAELFLKCLKTGAPITTDLLRENDLYFYNKEKAAPDRFRVVALLNRVLLLTGVKEVVRRMHGSDITLPFATAYVQGLQLVAKGHLKMKDLFGKNAPYGIPTASSLTASHVASAAREKLKRLNTLFVKKFGEDDTQYSREYFHQLLRNEGYGSGDLTDGSEYETSEDEEEVEKKSFFCR